MADAAKTQRTAAKTKFTRAEKSLSNAMLSDGTLVETITRRFNELKNAYAQTETTHDAYVLALGEDVQGGEEEWIDDIIGRFELIETNYDKKVKELSEAIAPIQAVPLAANGTVIAGNGKDVFKHDKIKYPEFDGNIRKYAKWKEGFEIHVKPLCKETQLAFILKSHLCSELREEMDILGGTDDEIWERLDQRFGNKSRLVDTILAEVKSIEHCNNDDSLTLNMIKVIERCYNELKATKREYEMNNTTIISMIEEKMPEEMSTEWIKLITKKDANHEEKFTLLKTLLDEWRGRIEYKVANLRTTSTDPSQESPVLLGNATNHHTNARRQQSSCWIHTTNGNGDHPIWRCRTFQNKSVDERIALVRENRACFKCLEKGHSAPSCPKTFKCTVPNCNQYHNKLLHKDNNDNTNETNNIQQQQRQQQQQQQQPQIQQQPQVQQQQQHMQIQQQIQQLQQQQRQLQQLQNSDTNVSGNNNILGQTLQTSAHTGGGVLLPTS